jgi:hypothetical protein
MRTTGNAPVFQVPKRGRPSARVLVTFLLCALLPPLGLVVVWRGLRCPVRGKVLLSAVAFLSMTVMLTTYIGYQMNSGILVPQQAAGQFAVNDYTSSGGSTTVLSKTPTAAPAQATAQATAPATAPASPEATPQANATEPEMTLAPANPFG